MIRQSRKIQFIILLVLVCLVGTMSIAYAVLSTTLNINGNAYVMDASWDVHFENIVVNPYSVSINPTITDKDKINFSADLITPGEFYKFTVDIVNDGSIDAMIESVIKSPELTTDQKKYLRYEVEYIDGTSINESQLLKSGETKTISVLVSYRNDIPINNLPTLEVDLDLEIRFVYVQATSLGNEISGSEKLVKVVSGDLNTIGSEICIDKECFYIISSDDYSVRILSKYSLFVNSYCLSVTECYEYGNTATGIQDSSMFGWKNGVARRDGVISFSNINYWSSNSYPMYIYDNNSNLYSYVENYVSYLETLGVDILGARLISYEELIDLGCDPGTLKCDGAMGWVGNSTYWTGSASGVDSLWFVRSDNILTNFSYVHNYGIGVRPVIEISFTEF